MPRSLFVIYGLLLGAGTCGVRFIWQLIFHSGNLGEPVAIYGAGAAGRQLLVSLANGNEYRPVLFLDDNPNLGGTTVSGVPVALADGPLIDKLLVGLEVEKVILAMPTIGPNEYQKKIDSIKSCGLPVLTIPSHSELVSGASRLGHVRDISIADILGRNEVPPNQRLLGRCITGKCVLVTGGGGSIGSELSRQILLQNPLKLIVLDQSEFNLYQISEEIFGLVDDLETNKPLFLPVLGSINDEKLLKKLLATEKINTVYHAAAYKHVPVIESQPEQGVQTNVYGTLNLVDAAISAKIENFVFISTDKAVRPANSMGASKRIAELVLQAKADMQQDTRISMVRFGNVLGSSGSVVPKFMKQIEEGGPITLTDPNVTRYFMTIPEAAQLVMQASSIAGGGEVFALDMGESVRIEELAISMVRLSGRKLKRDTGKDGDIEIQVHGLRPGEKMYEELFLTKSHSPTIVSKVFSAKEYWIAWERLSRELECLNSVMLSGDRQSLRQELLRIAFLQSDVEDVRATKVKVVAENSNRIAADIPL